MPLAAADIPGLPAASAASLAHGTQAVAARPAAGAAPPPAAHVCLANVRLPGVATDLLVTLNVPVAAGGGAPGSGSAALESGMRDVLRSLRVNDWALFGAEPRAAAAAAAAAV